MVHYLSKDDILYLCGDLCDRLHPPSTLWPELVRTVNSQIQAVADAPESAYVPRHKWLEFITGCVSHALSIAQETHLRTHEARAMLQQLIGAHAPLSKQFYYDAALEQARYEPIMLTAAVSQKISERTQILQKRWQAMCAVQQAHQPLSASSLASLDYYVASAIEDPAFCNYRTGPMLQFFADMLLHASTCEAENIPEMLESKIGQQSPLWRRFALKSSRFSKNQKQPSPSVWPTLPTPNRLH